MSAETGAEKLPDAARPLQNAKHEAVLQAYFADPNRVGWRAYVVVYPKSSEGAAKTAFSRLLKNAAFTARLQLLEGGATQVAVTKSGIQIADVVAELAKIGFANAKHYLRILADGEPAVDLSSLSEDQFAALAEVTVEDYVDGRGEDARDVRKVRFKLHNKQAALVSILEHLGGFPARKLADPDGRALGTGAAETFTEKLSDLEVARRLAFALTRGERAKAKGKK